MKMPKGKGGIGLGGALNAALALMFLPSLVDPLDEIAGAAGMDPLGRRARGRKMLGARAESAALDSASASRAEQEEQGLNRLLTGFNDVKGIGGGAGQLKRQMDVEDLIEGHEHELGMVAQVMDQGPTLEELALRMGY